MAVMVTFSVKLTVVFMSREKRRERRKESERFAFQGFREWCTRNSVICLFAAWLWLPGEWQISHLSSMCCHFAIRTLLLYLPTPASCRGNHPELPALLFPACLYPSHTLYLCVHFHVCTLEVSHFPFSFSELTSGWVLTVKYGHWWDTHWTHTNWLLLHCHSYNLQLVHTVQWIFYLLHSHVGVQREKTH